MANSIDSTGETFGRIPMVECAPEKKELYVMGDRAGVRESLGLKAPAKRVHGSSSKGISHVTMNSAAGG